jgi:molybdopterin synthase catalytic subunit
MTRREVAGAVSAGTLHPYTDRRALMARIVALARPHRCSVERIPGMRVTLRHFALIRETIGRQTEERTVEPGTTISGVYDLLSAEQPRLAPLKPSVMMMANQQYVPADYAVSDGDEIVFIPPVSGGSDDGRLFRVTTDELDPRETERAVADPAAGAIVTFTGVVRDNGRGQAVSALDYEAYAPAAEKMLAQVADEIDEKWGLKRVAIIHRTGLLTVGEASVVISISSPHREAAFEACLYAIERLKEIVPIWKKEHYADGAVWIGSEADYQRETGRLPS